MGGFPEEINKIMPTDLVHKRVRAAQRHGLQIAMAMGRTSRTSPGGQAGSENSEMASFGGLLDAQSA